MADTSQQEFIAKATAEIVADIEKKQTGSLARAHPTQQQLEEKEQKRLRGIAYRLPSSGKPPVDFDALERAQKAKQSRREGKILPSQVIMGAQRLPQPGEL